MTMVIKRPEKAIPAGEFKAKCLSLMDEVERTGESLVITKRGRPVARLIPASPTSQSVFGSMRGTATIKGDIISPLAEPWEVLQDEG